MFVIYDSARWIPACMWLSFHNPQFCVKLPSSFYIGYYILWLQFVVVSEYVEENVHPYIEHSVYPTMQHNE